MIDLPSRGRLALATAGALGAALLLLATVVLPAGYGIDPLRSGHLLGIAKEATAAPAPPLVANASVPLRLFNVSFPPAARLLLDTSGTAKEGEAQEVKVAVAAPNLIALTAVLSWQDPGVGGQPSQPDVFQIQWTSPDGAQAPPNQGRSDASGAGSVQVVAVLGRAPDPGTVEAPDEAAAQAAVRAAYPATQRGNGEWRLAIRLVDAPGVAGALPDGENAWTLKVFADAYAPALGASQATARLEDTVTITVPARSGLEYKLRMDEGQALSYDWKATADLAYDFHGERSDAGGAAESHEKGTAAARSGDFRAPFTGRHGWYWQNDGLADATVTLHVKGEYRIIGVVRPA